MNTQVLLPQEDYGLLLEDRDLDVVLNLKLVDDIDELAMTVPAKVLDAPVRQLILGLDVVDAGLASSISSCTKKCLGAMSFAR